MNFLILKGGREPVIGLPPITTLSRKAQKLELVEQLTQSIYYLFLYLYQEHFKILETDFYVKI
jgi:hypothetical protein